MNMEDHVVLDRSEADRLYDATGEIHDRADLLATFIDGSERYRAANAGVLGIRYGISVDETLDIFLPSSSAPGAPVHIFIHGGFWYQFGSREWSFVAERLTAAGAIVVIPRYSLCPKVGVAEIVAQMRSMLCWVWRNVAQYGGDREKIFLSGHSVGGQLALELTLTDWEAEYGLPATTIKGVTSISGLYDLTPIALCYVQEYACLSSRDSAKLSPISHVTPVATPLILTAGALEPEGFLRQMEDFRSAWEAAGNAVDAFVLDDHNHLTILEEVSVPGGRIIEAILAQMRLGS